MSYNIPPITQSQRHGFLDEKLLNNSSDLFKNKIMGILIGIIANILYIVEAWYKRSTILSLCFFIFLYLLVVKIILAQLEKLCEKEKNNEEKKEEYHYPPNERESLHCNSECKQMKKIIGLEDIWETIRIIVVGYILMKITSHIPDKCILLIVLNIIIFYSPIEKKCPHFLFKTRMSVKQIIEGIFGLIECLIPRYEEPKEEKK